VTAVNFLRQWMLDNSEEETFFCPGVRMGLIVCEWKNCLRQWMSDNWERETFFRPGVRMGLIVRVTNFLRRRMPENFR